MAECAACGKPLRKGAYSWTIGWSIAERSGKKDFDVRFHNKPECIGVMTQRMDDYAFEQRMNAMLGHFDEVPSDEGEIAVYSINREDF